MGLKEFRDDVGDEVSTILDSSFSIEVTKTASVPHSDDPAITFPDLDNRTQGTKLLETCVLYVDMRRSTQLSLKHRQTTVAKLYSSFVRAMTRCATNYSGEVRGIIGDRIMVIFEPDDCFTKAVDTAVLMNSVCKYLLNKYFTQGDVTFGIGIDYGRMLATKTGIRRHGSAQPSYRSLVWLGRPANIASKLTDAANKPADTYEGTNVQVLYNRGLFGSFWVTERPREFVSKLVMRPNRFGANHTDPGFQTCYPVKETIVLTPSTPPILMTRSVFEGLRSANPDRECLKKGWFKKVNVSVPDYAGDIFGGDVIFTVFRE
jgi:adenylate cyclase